MNLFQPLPDEIIINIFSDVPMYYYRNLYYTCHRFQTIIRSFNTARKINQIDIHKTKSQCTVAPFWYWLLFIFASITSLHFVLIIVGVIVIPMFYEFYPILCESIIHVLYIDSAIGTLLCIILGTIYVWKDQSGQSYREKFNYHTCGLYEKSQIV